MPKPLDCCHSCFHFSGQPAIVLCPLHPLGVELGYCPDYKRVLTGEGLEDEPLPPSATGICPVCEVATLSDRLPWECPHCGYRE